MKIFQEKNLKGKRQKIISMKNSRKRQIKKKIESFEV